MYSQIIEKSLHKLTPRRRDNFLKSSYRPDSDWWLLAMNSAMASQIVIKGKTGFLRFKVRILNDDKF